MPIGLKKYLEVELFPQIQIKFGKGILISTAHRWIDHHGFHYMKYKKASYFDGHERPDVVHCHQNVFLPLMAGYQSRLVEYRRVEESGHETFKEVNKSLPDGVRKLVLCAHVLMMSPQCKQTMGKRQDGVQRMNSPCVINRYSIVVGGRQVGGM